MTITINSAADALGSDPLADPDEIMKPRGRELVRTELAHWRQKNLRGHVLAVGKGDSFGTVDDIDALWKRLHYVDDHDLLVVVAQGRGFVARGWNQTLKGPSRSGTLADEAISIRARARQSHAAIGDGAVLGYEPAATARAQDVAERVRAVRREASARRR